MDSDTLISLITKLDGDLDHLKVALTPLLKEALTDTAGTLPLLDKAHLYILVTHVIELLLYCNWTTSHPEFSLSSDCIGPDYLQLNGVEVQDHPIFRELTRVKQYMKKINEAETGPTKNTLNLDKPAVQRFINHALVRTFAWQPLVFLRQGSTWADRIVQAGNEKYDTKRAQQQQPKEAVPRNEIDKDELRPGRRRKRAIENDQRNDKEAGTRRERKRRKADSAWPATSSSFCAGPSMVSYHSSLKTSATMYSFDALRWRWEMIHYDIPTSTGKLRVRHHFKRTSDSTVFCFRCWKEKAMGSFTRRNHGKVSWDTYSAWGGRKTLRRQNQDLALISHLVGKKAFPDIRSVEQTAGMILNIK